MAQQHLSVTPAKVGFDNVRKGEVYSAFVEVKNLITGRPQSVRIKQPTTKWFRVVGMNQTSRIAPGLALKFEVVFDARLLQTLDRDYHDCISITSELDTIELWVHASCPKPIIQLTGSLDFGMVCANSTAVRQLQLMNKGAVGGEYSIQWDKALPLSVEPSSGLLGPAGSANSTNSIVVKLAPQEGGTVLGDMVISTAGTREACRTTVAATIVQQTFQLVDSKDHKAAIAELDFGRMFFGDAGTRTVSLYNNGPVEAHFDVSYGTAADMKALAVDGEAELGSAPTEAPAADEVTRFLRAACVRAKAQEEGQSILLVTPTSGAVAPYSMAPLIIMFRPRAATEKKGFTTQPIPHTQQALNFDYLVQVNVAGDSKPLRLPVKGHGLAPQLLAKPQLLHFGNVPSNDWADQLLQLALGNHQCSIGFSAMSSRRSESVLQEVTVQLQGSSLTVGENKPLPGGTAAMPATFTKPRQFIDEDEAAVAHLTAKNTFSRPQLWETADAVLASKGHGHLDSNSRQLQMARAAHADQYTSFIRAGRTAKAQKHLTQAEGEEGDVNLGMRPYRGLRLGKLEVPQQVEPLWTVKQNSTARPAVQRLPPASVLLSIPKHKEWPETAQERAETSMVLSANQLSKLVVSPRQLDFCKVSPALPALAWWVVTNTLATAIHVVLDLQSVQELTCSTPSQVIPPGATAKFELVLRCQDVQQLKERVQYCINGCSMQPLDVLADVVAVTLHLSSEELLFSFSLDNWEDFVEQMLVVENPHNFPVDYEWALSDQSPAFSVSPVSGIVKAKSTCTCTVRWTPGLAAKTKAKAAEVGASSGGSASVQQGASIATQKQVKAVTSGRASPAMSAGAASGNGGNSALSPLRNVSGAIAVELPPHAAEELASGVDSVTCQQTSFMKLMLKGGGDAPPKKVVLHGELPAGLLKFREKEVNLGPVPLHHQQTMVVQLKNTGTDDAAFRVCSNSLLSVSPSQGRVAAESVLELDIDLTTHQEGPVMTVLELEVRGSKLLRLPIRAEGVLARVCVQEGALTFPHTFIGSSSQLPLTLVNSSPVSATLLCDLSQQPEFDLLLSREVWASAGYIACPVQRIGANGEMSAVGSKRPSRRMSSQGGRNMPYGEGGYKFLIQLNPSSSLPLQMAYRPSKAHVSCFQLPIVLQSSGADASAACAVSAGRLPRSSATCSPAKNIENCVGATAANRDAGTAGTEDVSAALCVKVQAAAVVPRIIASKSSVDFDLKVVQRSRASSKSPYSQVLYIRNNTSDVLQVAVGAPCSTTAAVSCRRVFTLEGIDCVSAPFTALSPEEFLEFTVRFTPVEAKVYEATLPLFMDGDRSTPYLQLHLAGTGVLPRLAFDVAECVLPAVPTNVTSTARFHIINGGYDNLELTTRLPPDSSHLPIRLAFPEGNLIGLAKERLPIDVSFKSDKPLCCTAMVEFLDDDGRAFGIAITASADRCSLTHQSFMQLNADNLQLEASAEGAGPLQLLDSPEYEMPVQEAIGPQQLTEGVCKYLAAVSFTRLGSAANRGGSGAGAADAVQSTSTGSNSAEALRHALRSSKGKQLLELVELLGGKAVSRKGLSSKPSVNKAEAVQQLLLLYDATLNHLRQHGALVNAVKPEYLLEENDFHRVMEARTAAAAGSPEQEEALELWSPVELNFELYSAQAWNCVLLQVFKVYVLAHVTPGAGMAMNNFADDMRNGLALGALLAAHWQGGLAGSLSSKLTRHVTDGRQLKANQELVVRAMQELCLPFELTAADIEEAEAGHMLLLVTYLFTALPQLLPCATLDFHCKLGEEQVKEVQLTNPTRRPLSYSVRLDGQPDFSLDSQMIKIDPGRSTQVPVRFAPSTSLPKTSRLVMMSRRETSAASAATLVFSLKGTVDSRAPLKHVTAQAMLYQLSVVEFNVTNPFQQGMQLMASTVFPDAFGLDRHRLRLRAGATERLRLSFLPFHLPPAHIPPGAEQLQAGQVAAVLKSTIDSLLVLSDSECGEFAYAISGEVLPPAVFMEHKVKVGIDGPQTIELQLPFTNHLLEAARRLFAEKHPLAKDKEQAVKLRADVGCAGDKGERLLEYAVSCSNSLLSCPSSITLRAGAPSAASVPGGRVSMAGAVNSRSSMTGAAAGVHGGSTQPQQEPGQENLLRLSLKPVGCGVCPARVTLMSHWDVRVLDLEVTAQSMGQACTLELECPARQQVVQELPLVNTNDGPITAVATLSGKGYSGPRDVSVAAKGSGVYALTFTPPGSGNYTGSLELFIAATGERNVYSLIGKGGEPLAEGHLVIECQARSQVSRRVQVPNVTGSLPLLYNVYVDLDCMSGPTTLACSSTRADTYKLCVTPLLSGTYWGSISFVAPDGNYCWYSVEVRASEPAHLGLIQVSCPVRQAMAIQVSLTNPTDKPLPLTVKYSTQSVVGPSSFVAPAGAPCTFECFYTPLLVGSEEGSLRLISDEAGEFLWRLALEATPGGPEHLPLLTAPLGSTARHTLVISNPTASEGMFEVTSSDARRFSATPSTIRVPGNGTAELVLEYHPGTVDVEETGVVIVSSAAAGQVEYICRGQGELPSGLETVSINAAVGASCTSEQLCWINPFSSTATVKVALSSNQPPGTFNLLLPGTQKAPSNQQYAANSAGSSGPTAVAQDSGSFAGDVDGEQYLERVESDPRLRSTRGVGRAQGQERIGGEAANALMAMVEAFGSRRSHGSGADDDQCNARGNTCGANRPEAAPVVLQQVAEVSVAAHGRLLLPVAFAPLVLREAAAQLTVALVEPAVQCRAPIRWQYQVKGLAHSDPHGVRFAVKCQAKQTAEEVLLKALSAQVKLAITCSNGARWVYDVQLLATAPEIDGVLTLEAHMNCTAELPLMLFSSGDQPQPFTAEFTPESPLNFDVTPASGLLPPCLVDHEAAEEAQQGEAAAAPVKVTFLCKELGKVMQGKLLVTTPDSQHTFIVKGREPAYVPPTRSRASASYITAGTASSTAKAGSRRNLTSAPALADEFTTGAGAPLGRAGKAAATASISTQERKGSKSFIQQNINAAAANAGTKLRGTRNQGRRLFGIVYVTDCESKESEQWQHKQDM
eukprot:gene12144-12282_t